jgi:predicted ester cyclase
MAAEQSKALANRFVEEVINQGNIDRAGEFFAADYVDHVPAPPGFPTGIEGLKHCFTLFRQAFPDLHYTVDDTIVEGDKVVQRVTGRGTMKGEFLGIPATGKQATWTEMHISRMGSEGKFVEHWGNVDQLGMLQQLGVIPVPGQAS